jgi:hypothetical protein
MGPNPTSPRGSRLWWCIVAACALHIAAWTAWFAIAARHPVREVPVAGGSGR